MSVSVMGSDFPAGDPPPPIIALAVSIFFIKRSRFDEADARSLNIFLGMEFSNIYSLWTVDDLPRGTVSQVMHRGEE